MRTLTFNVMSGIPGFNVKKTAPVIELVQDIPKLLSYKVIPSLKVLNSILQSGVFDAGTDGGCEWPPFQLSEDEYGELVSELIKSNSYLYREEPPGEVDNYEYWLNWVTNK